jgi:putative membrane-bound dehydrogenase-like protein
MPFGHFRIVATCAKRVVLSNRRREARQWLTVLALGAACLALCNPRVSGQGFSAAEAVQRMKLPAGFTARVIAAEPLVRQPVAIEFDDRGRLWVIQYLQYPNPEGLKRVAVDRYSRTKYDRVPEPPPRGPRGADRITILEDTDGDGQADRGRDFVSGLNLATGLAFGHGGVFVLQTPYLLFYADRDRDDRPDGDPEVLLTGFGMEDAHSVANSLTWGPDGWLYGCQGSTVTAKIRGIEFQQGVWRYHPVTKAFELFCEGGGNSWGLDFDRRGRLFYSTNYGGHTLLHGVQGAYYIKSFGKHGALHNPHAYGYFEHAPHANFRGGHVTVGGIVYQADQFPATFRDTYIAGDLLGHGVYWHTIHPHGSTVRTAHGGELMAAGDSWFAPTDVTTGPDGAIYVADWHDARTAHPDPDADWDRSNGRIYRLEHAPSATAPPSFDFARMTTDELLRLHSHRNQWHVRRARLELVRRWHRQSPKPDELVTLRQRLREQLMKGASIDAELTGLESLWTLYGLEGFDESVANATLGSSHASIRAWTIRLLGDAGRLSPDLAHRLDAFAETEPDIAVRQQLAASAARFAARDALPMINANINRDLADDRADPFMPLLWWWAVERHSVSGRDEVMKRFSRPTLWKSTLGRDLLLPKLIRRYAAEASREGLDAVVRLMASAPNDAARAALWPSVLLGWREQPRERRTETRVREARESAFGSLVLAAWRRYPDNATLLDLALALRLEEPRDHVRRMAFANTPSATPALRPAATVAPTPAKPVAATAATTTPATTPATTTATAATTTTAAEVVSAATQAAALDRLAPHADVQHLQPAMRLFQSSPSEAVRSAALRVLAEFEDPTLPEALIEQYRGSPPPSLAIRTQIRATLLSRASSANAWLEAVDRGHVPASETTLDEIRRVALFESEELNRLVAKHWGKLDSGTREEKLAEVRRLNNDLRAGPGSVDAGRLLFRKHCGVCHPLFGEGAKVGPDLTTANRQDRDFLLVSMVDPSSVIRKEYLAVVVETNAGRTLSGLPIAKSDSSLTLVDAKGERLELPLSEIAELRDSPVSLMPENLYRQFTPQQLRDLFAYLQRATAP